MTAAALDDLTIVVDETHEDRVCERWTFRCPNKALLHMRVTCGCVYTFCLTCTESAREAESEGRPLGCLAHGTSPVPWIVRTWPVTR